MIRPLLTVTVCLAVVATGCFAAHEPDSPVSPPDVHPDVRLTVHRAYYIPRCLGAPHDDGSEIAYVEVLVENDSDVPVSMAAREMRATLAPDSTPFARAVADRYPPTLDADHGYARFGGTVEARESLVISFAAFLPSHGRIGPSTPPNLSLALDLLVDGDRTVLDAPMLLREDCEYQR